MIGFITKESSNKTYKFSYLNKYFKYDEWSNINQKVNNDNNLITVCIQQDDEIQPYVELNQPTFQQIHKLSSWQRRKHLPSLRSKAILTPHWGPKILWPVAPTTDHLIGYMKSTQLTKEVIPRKF
jgi:hypothetical protein